MLARYERHLRSRGNSPGTIYIRLGDLRRFGRFVDDLAQASRADVDRYLEAHETWSPEYRNKVVQSLKLFYRWARRQQHVASNPTRHLEKVPVPPALPRPAPDDVVLDAFEAGSLAERAMLCLGATEGLRRTEIATAHPMNRDGAQLRVLGKGSKERVVPLDPLTRTLLEEIERFQGRDEYYFIGRFGGHVHPDTVYAWLRRRLGDQWSTHHLRHRAATIALEKTMDLRGVQELLGHARSDTTDRYTRVSAERLRHLVETTSLSQLLAMRAIMRVSERLPDNPREGGDADIAQLYAALEVVMQFTDAGRSS